MLLILTVSPVNRRIHHGDSSVINYPVFLFGELGVGWGARMVEIEQARSHLTSQMPAAAASLQPAADWSAWRPGSHSSTSQNSSSTTVGTMPKRTQIHEVKYLKKKK